MNKNSYHHGNLKQELIDKGIQIFNTEGESSLSLRKVAAACGVSHAAPYAHFKDKDELLLAMKESVSSQFYDELKKELQRNKDKTVEEQIIAIGREYVRFFHKHPDYFLFLFYGQKITVHLDYAADYSEDFLPYRLFRELFDKYADTSMKSASKMEKEIQLIKAWTVVQGLTSLVCMDNVTASMEWEDYIEQLIN